MTKSVSARKGTRVGVCVFFFFSPMTMHTAIYPTARELTPCVPQTVRVGSTFQTLCQEKYHMTMRHIVRVLRGFLMEEVNAPLRTARALRVVTIHVHLTYGEMKIMELSTEKAGRQSCHCANNDREWQGHLLGF